MAETKSPHILIAGAGIGGLVLAQCLRKQGLHFTIYDRDTSTNSRAQGWAIALHTILADLVASVPDDMPSIEVVNHLLPLKSLQPQICFYDARSSETSARGFIVESQSVDEVGYGEGRVIRANRNLLRDWLATNIDVQWGKHVATVKQDEQGATVEFTDGTTAVGDILVGADGARNAVRQAILPSARLENVPDCFVTGEVTLHKEDYEEQMQLAHSAYAVMGSDFHIFVGLNKVADDASSADYYWDAIWYDDARKGPHWVDTASSGELYDFALSKTAALDPKFTDIIRLTKPEDVMTPPLILRDLELESMPVGKVTLLGDAAHAMVPFRGEGGCHAIEDAIKLSRALAGGGDLGAYQEEMLARGVAAVRASRAAGHARADAGGTRSETRKAWGQPVKPRA